MADDRLRCDQCPVRATAVCAVLDNSERAELGRLGRTVRLRRGETLFAAGDESGRCATLIRGALKIASHGEDGTERVVGLVHPAGFVGELFGALEHHDVVALTDCQLCLFDRADYNRLIERFPALARALLHRTELELAASRGLLALQSRRDARGRVAGFLLAMARAASHSECHPAARFELPLSRGEMAGLLGVTIETISRQLTALERSGTIARDGARGIRLANPAALERLAA